MDHQLNLKMNPAFKRITLSNGLSVLLKEIHSAPIISHWVWYRVGLRNESPGYFGLSHWVEHMQFKGTTQHSQEALEKLISRVGGIWNAYTYLDWTAYFETMPANKIDIALSIEADRMCNSLFNPGDVESERNVILSELEGNENDPLYLLSDAVQKTAFQNHPYRNDVIGDRADLERIKRDDLVHHYKRFYAPNNAVVCLAGDFKIDEMENKVVAYYDHIPPIMLPDKPNLPIEQILSPNEVEIRGSDEMIYIQIAYSAPAGNDPDFFIFSIIDSLLTGPSGMNMFGGSGLSNKTSRLYRKIIEKNYAVSVFGGIQATIDPDLYVIDMILNPNQSPEVAVKIFDNQINLIRSKRINELEINRAIKQAKALFAYSLENITNQAFWLGYSEMFADYSWFEHFIEHLQNVTVKDIQRVAQKYLDPEKRILGYYLPQNHEDTPNES